MLEVSRGEEFEKLNIPLPQSTSFSFSDPQSCSKRKSFLSGIAEYLVNVQQSNGRWKPGVGGDADVYTTAFCGLVLLANNDPAHLSAIKKALEFVKMASIDKINPSDPKTGPKNWQTAANGILQVGDRITKIENKIPDVFFEKNPRSEVFKRPVHQNPRLSRSIS